MSGVTLKPTDGRGPWKEFLCRACGLIYNEGEGDLDSGIAPGTRFEDIPDDWSCPVCGVRKQDFEPYERAEIARQPVPDVAIRAKRGGVVIVGAGLAGWSAAEAIRALDPDLPITIVSACAGDVYNKPELAVAMARGMTVERLRRETGSQAARRLGVRLISDTFATGLSPRSRRLRTTRGTLAYDSLVLAFGARAMPPAGLDPSLCWRINDLAAWSRLSAALAGRPHRLAIIGAGMVGCELAEDMARAGHAVNLISLTEEPMEGLFPRQAGQRLRRGLQGLGIRFHGATRVESLSAMADGRHLTLSGGTELVVDHVITATGLVTSNRMVKAAGLDFDNGISVEPGTMRASIDGIHALGDCVSINGAPCRFVEPIAAQAAAIAACVTGGDAAEYRHRPPVIRLKTRSAPIMVEGHIHQAGEWLEVSSTEERLVMEQWFEGVMSARLIA